MKRTLRKKLFLRIIIIFIISIFVEIFMFNFSYFRINKNDKGIHKLNMESIVYNDLDFENNKLHITGSDPYFEIPSDKYISLLKLDLNRSKEGFLINVIDNKGISHGVYNSNSDIKDFVYIKINNNIKNIRLYIKMNNNEKYVGIKDIIIDNKFYFNIIRFLIVLFILYLLWLIIIYKKFLSENIHIAFLVISLTLGILITICIPPYYLYDEGAHFVRSYETGSFNFNFSKDKSSNWISNIGEFFSYNSHYEMYNSYNDRISNAKVFFNNDYTNIQHFNSPEDTYLFVPYIPSAIGIFIGKIFKLPFILTFYLGRIFSLFIYSILGALIIKHIKAVKRLTFMILLFPINILAAGSYSVDPMTVIFSMASIAIFVNMLCAEKYSIGYKSIVGLIACMSITAMCKVPYAPLILVIFAVPNVNFKDQINRRIIFIKILALLPVGLAAIGTFLYGLTKNINQWKIPGVDVHGQILFIINDLPRYIHIIYNYTATNLLPIFETSISLLGYNGSVNSIWVFTILISLFIVAFSDDESRVMNLLIKEKKIILLSIILSWGLALSALYITFTPVGKYTVDGFQGRYIIPLILPILLLFKNNKIINKFKKENLNYFIIFEFAFILTITMLKIFVKYNN